MVQSSDCESKHLKLASIIVVIFLAISGATFGILSGQSSATNKTVEAFNQDSQARLDSVEARVRESERTIARFEERQAIMLQMLREVRDSVSKDSR
jgi:hypothetical protein